MSYSREQREKHKSYIENQMADCSNPDRASVLSECIRTWPDDDQVKVLVAEKKAEIAKRATPEEMEELFRDIRI